MITANLERKDLEGYKDPIKRLEYQRNYMRDYMKKHGSKYRKKYVDKRRNRWKNSGDDFKQKVLAAQRKKYSLTQQKLMLMKTECKVCAYSIHPEILEFHHRDKELKSFELSGGNLYNRRWETILLEVEKCDTLCPNCHRWLHYQEKEFFINHAKNNKRNSA